MVLKLYEMVQQVIGPVPEPYQFVYAIAVIIEFVIIVYCLVWPWKMLFK